MANEILKEIHGLIRGVDNPYIREWKADGKPVIGYFCHYMPRELLLSAGALPVRLRGAGSEDSSRGDALMSSRVCTFVRHVVSLALEGEYDFLDGVICLNTCDHVRRAADVFNKKTDVGFKGFISVPRATREVLLDYYVNELRKIVEQLEEYFEVSIGKDGLRASIHTMNKVRSLLKEINRMRLEDRPKLSGADSLAVHIASQQLPPQNFVELADRLIDVLKSSPGLESPNGRLLMIGAELDEPAFVEAIESQGALVVADQLCFGARQVMPPIDEDAGDPLEAIARRYFFSLSCARMIGDFPKRWEELKTAVKEADADGVVFERIVFCDPWGADLHNINSRIKKEKPFPMLALTREYNIVATGQIKTRVQAFLEKIEISRARKAAGKGSL